MPSQWLRAIQQRLEAQGCLTASCQDGACHLTLPGRASTRCLTHVDHCDELAPPDKRRCDFLLFCESRSGRRRWVVPIELKGGTVRLNDLDGIHGQLQTGACVAADLLPMERSRLPRLRPVLGHGRPLPTWVGRMLTTPRYRIELSGRREIIRTKMCGESVADILT